MGYFGWFCRLVSVSEGHELSFRYNSQFYEVSAAENYAGVSLAISALLREARSGQLLRALPIRRKIGVNSVSKVVFIIIKDLNAMTYDYALDYRPLEIYLEKTVKVIGRSDHH